MIVPSASETSRAYVRGAAQSLASLRARAPRIHCITNVAADVLSANVLLAVGAVPSLTIAPDEVGEFVAGANGLLINLGTLDKTRHAAIAIAIEAAAGAGLPWVLDPVLAERSGPRLEFANSLCGLHPAAIRANGAEVAALSGHMGAGEDAAAELARSARSCVLLSGARDWVGDGTRAALVAGGDPLMTKVTAMGCALGALVAAFCTVERDPFLAALGAALCFGVAGEIAGARARGPGSFQIGFLDALHALDEDMLVEHGKVSQ